MVTRFVQDQEGATAVEYGLIASLIAIVIVGAVTVLGSQLSTTFSTVNSAIKGQ